MNPVSMVEIVPAAQVVSTVLVQAISLGTDASTVSIYLARKQIQWPLYFKTTHGTKKMWSYIAGVLKIKVI